MEGHQLIQEFLGRLTTETRLEVLKQTDAFGNTGLHEAAIVENPDVARVLVDFARKSADDDAYKNLLQVQNGLRETPVYRAAALGKTKVLEILNKQVGDLGHHFHRYDDKTILHMAVLGQRFGISVRKMYRGIWRQAIEGCPGIKKIWTKKKMHENAVALVKMLVEKDRDRSNPSFIPQTPKREISKITNISTISLGFGKGDDINVKKLVDFSAEEMVDVLGIKDCTKKAVDDHKNATTESRTILFAASNGITEILEEILQQNPQAILSKVNEKGQTILRVTIRRRQHNIFNLITEKMQLYVPKWAARIDNKGYTILQHVADMKHYEQGTRPGPVLQFQEELQWFTRVKDKMPPHYAMHRDKIKNMNASDLFEQTHEDQLRKAQEWIKETSQSCSTLAILIATVVFAAAYTVPGGTNDKVFPNFLDSPLSYAFTVMDVASLSFSLSSVAMFLSIFTSPRESSDFLSDLSGKLTIGFTLLFFSVLTSMITFSASLLLIIRLEKKWTAALYAAAIFPVIVLAQMEFLFYANFGANLKEYYLEFFNIFPLKKKKKKTLCH